MKKSKDFEREITTKCAPKQRKNKKFAEKSKKVNKKFAQFKIKP